MRRLKVNRKLIMSGSTPAPQNFFLPIEKFNLKYPIDSVYKDINKSSEAFFKWLLEHDLCYNLHLLNYLWTWFNRRNFPSQTYGKQNIDEIIVDIKSF